MQIARTGFMCAAALMLAAGCRREQRDFTEVPPAATANDAVSMSQLQPGGARQPEPVRNAYESSAYAVSEGQNLYNQYNCSGCHFHGGGGIGPALMDDEWIYGSSPQNIFQTIVEGRPNGMPSYRGKIANEQVWQIVAYVRSLSGQLRGDIPSQRDDHMQMDTWDESKERKPARTTGTFPEH